MDYVDAAMKKYFSVCWPSVLLDSLTCLHPWASQHVATVATSKAQDFFVFVFGVSFLHCPLVCVLQVENRKDMLPHLYAKFDKTFFAAFAVEVAKGTSTEGRREEREVERKIERWKERGGKGEVERGGGGGGAHTQMHTPRCTHPDTWSHC